MGELSSDRFLMVQAGTALCALPLEHVIEIMRPLPIDPISHAPRFVLGMSVLRGSPVPVVDLAILLEGDADQGRAHASTSMDNRFVSLRVDQRCIALAVHGVMGVRTLSKASFEELPPLLHDEHSELVTSIATLDRSLFWVLEAARLYPAELVAASEASQ